MTYKIPDEISFEAAAGILMAYLTSDFALHRRAQIKEGERVLVNAAAGGVGLAAVQLAKLSNAEVIAAVGSKEKAEFIKKYNPDLVINYFFKRDGLIYWINFFLQIQFKQCLHS